MPEHRERAIANGDDYVRTPGGVLVPSWSQVAQPVEAKPIAIGLFSGAGGMDCGLAMAGFHVVAASEWCPVAAQTYLCNLGSPDTLVYVGRTAGEDSTKRDTKALEPFTGELVRAGDIPLFENAGTGWIAAAADHEDGCADHADDEASRESFHHTYCLGGRDHDAEPCELFLLCDVHELTGELILGVLGCESDDISLVVGGPPCQGFSRANGARSRDDGRNQLVFEFARLVCEIRPKAMMMENVPGIIDMVTPEGVPVIDALSLILENGGMGEYDALRRSLAANAGAGAIVKGAKRPKKDRRAAVELDEELPEESQLALEVPG